jgi:hypothetical protein
MAIGVIVTFMTPHNKSLLASDPRREGVFRWRMTNPDLSRDLKEHEELPRPIEGLVNMTARGVSPLTPSWPKRPDAKAAKP